MTGILKDLNETEELRKEFVSDMLGSCEKMLPADDTPSADEATSTEEVSSLESLDQRLFHLVSQLPIVAVFLFLASGLSFLLLEVNGREKGVRSLSARKDYSQLV